MEPEQTKTPADAERADRLKTICWIVLGAAGAASAVLLLWLNRGTTFYVDEMIWFGNLAGDNDLASIIHPHNSHLIGTSRLLFLAIAELAGPDYVIVRIVAAASVLLCAGLLYVWARRRIGPVWALLPAILLLFYGSAWQHVVGPIGFTITFSIALGIAALLALERDDRRGDRLACALLVLSLFTYTVGLGYLVGVGISVVLRRDRFRRAWIFLVPFLLYVAWWLWAQQFDQGRTSVANAGHVISFLWTAVESVGGALSGLAIPFSRFGEVAPISNAPPGPLGPVIAVALIAAVAWRLYRGGYSKTIYSSLGVLATYWLAAALSEPILLGPQADVVRYIFPGSVGVLLVLVDAAKGLRIRAGWAVALASVFLFSLAMNLVFLRDGASFLRAQAVSVRTNLAMLELANGSDPGDGPIPGGGAVSSELSADIPFLDFGPDRDEYLQAVARYGSPAFDLDEVRALDPAGRQGADVALAQVYGLGLTPTDTPEDRRNCEVATAAAGTFRIPAGGIDVKPRGSEPVTLALSRFGDPPGNPLNPAPSGEWTQLALPADGAPEPWYGTITAGDAATICPIG